MSSPVEKSERERQIFMLTLRLVHDHRCRHLSTDEVCDSEPVHVEALVQAAFEAGRSAGLAGWISVEERLPPEGHYLVWSKLCKIPWGGTLQNGQWFYTAAEGAEDGWEVDDGSGVTHWQPLPAGPIADKGDGNG